MNSERRGVRGGRAMISAVAALALLAAVLFLLRQSPGSTSAEVAGEAEVVAGVEPVSMSRSMALVLPRAADTDAAAEPRPAESRQLTETTTHDDFPAAAVAPDGTVWCTYVAYHQGNPIDQDETDAGRFETLRTRGNGDQIRLMSYTDETWSPPLNVTGQDLDVWRPTIVVDADGTVWTFWAQQVEGNWDLYTRGYDPEEERFGDVHRLTDDPGADINVVAVGVPGETGAWVAWQARRGESFDIRLARMEEGTLKGEQRVSFSEANDWHPAIAASSRGDIWVAWDTYHKGDYDVYARRLRGDQLDEPVPVATSTRFEARPNLLIDDEDRVWIAFEDADSNWGKDFGQRLIGQGVPFYEERNILIRCLTQDGLKRTRRTPQSELIFTHYDDTRWKHEFRHRINMPRLSFDGAGNIWLLYRRHPQPEDAVGEQWISLARYYDGDRWSEEILLENSANLLDNRPAIVPLSGGELLAVYSSDGRTRARNAGLTDLHAALLVAEAEPKPPVLIGVDPEGDLPPIPPIDPNEAEHVRRCREYRVEAGDKTYRLLRGEFHRHTEMSAHRDWDGPMEEVWRYGLDVAAMDWIGPGDHDYAVEQEYMWWLTQKQIDLYYAPEAFLTMYTYERSRRYPSGHRNVMFAERGIRSLPTMRGGPDQEFGTPEEGSPDIQNLYRYLKFFDGICSSHTSATNMGTDWRDSDPEVEPVVEIFQGHRQNYEETNAPLAARNPAETIQGYRPAGFVWEAFKKGIRLGFQASSDHVSTHTSYAIVLAEEPTREGILEAFKRRHCYAANDNIILDVRCGEQIMGDEFTRQELPRLDVNVVGTAPIARIDIVRQINREEPAYVYSLSPDEEAVRFNWTDMEAQAGEVNMYYVRVLQEDNRLAWGSPMWVHYEP